MKQADGSDEPAGGWSWVDKNNYPVMDIDQSSEVWADGGLLRVASFIPR